MVRFNSRPRSVQSGGKENLGILKDRNWPALIKIEVPILQLFILGTWYIVDREPIDPHSLFDVYKSSPKDIRNSIVR